MNNSLKTIIEAIQDKKAKNIVTIDMTQLDGAICDTFVICNADSTTQVCAIADGVDEKMVEIMQEDPIRVQGKDNGIWVIMDYGDVMVHVFQSEAREFYALDQLWSDLPSKKHQSFE